MTGTKHTKFLGPGQTEEDVEEEDNRSTDTKYSVSVDGNQHEEEAKKFLRTETPFSFDDLAKFSEKVEKLDRAVSTRIGDDGWMIVEWSGHSNVLLERKMIDEGPFRYSGSYVSRENEGAHCIIYAADI